jgi:hypothetical protein
MFLHITLLTFIFWLIGRANTGERLLQKGKHQALQPQQRDDSLADKALLERENQTPE